MDQSGLVVVFLMVMAVMALGYERIASTAGGLANIGPLEGAALSPFLGVLAVTGSIAFLIASRQSGRNR